MTGKICLGTGVIPNKSLQLKQLEDMTDKKKDRHNIMSEAIPKMSLRKQLKDTTG